SVCSGRRGATNWPAAAALAMVCAHAFADEADSEPSVTPYRPTVSNPADLPAPGWFEAEFGGLHTRNEDRSRADSVPWLLKYAFDENHGLLVGGNAYAAQHAPNAVAQNGFGDTSIEWKQRFPVDAQMAFGYEAGVVLPTASHALGVDEPVWLANG